METASDRRIRYEAARRAHARHQARQAAVREIVECAAACLIGSLFGYYGVAAVCGLLT